MAKKNFVHLHVHTKYSIGDGIADIMDLISATKNAGMVAVAVTDNCVMHGVAEFYCEAISQGIKPIIGCEVYVAEKDCYIGGIGKAGRDSHLVLLAESRTGYFNLIKLVPKNGKHCIGYEDLRHYREGLICLSGSKESVLYRFLTTGKEERADDLVRKYLDIYGKDNFFLELQWHGRKEERIANASLARLAKKYGLSLVATNEVRFLRRKDQEVYDVWRCVCKNRKYDEWDSRQYITGEYFFKTAEQMTELFQDYQDYPEALETTNRIAERCNVKLEFSQQQRSIPVLVTFPPDISSWQPILGLYDGATNIQLLEAVMDYVKKRYGYRHVAKIMTADKYRTRSVFKKVGRVFEMPIDTIYSISDLIPAEHNITMEAAIKKSGELALAYYGVEFSDENQEITQAMDFAGIVQNLPHAFVPHPNAFVATRNPLTDYFPMQMYKGGLMTEYDCRTLEKLGIQKMILGKIFP